MRRKKKASLLASCFLPQMLRLNPILTRRSLFRPQVFSRCISLKPDFSKLKLKEQPPGYVVGTVNDAYVPPEPDHFHGGYHWTYEKIITIAMIPLFITPFAAGAEYPLVDSIFSVLLVFHCRAGFESCIIDYIPKRVYGVWHKMALYLLDAATGLSLYGVYVLETENNGIFDLIQKLWGA